MALLESKILIIVKIILSDVKCSIEGFFSGTLFERTVVLETKSPIVYYWCNITAAVSRSTSTPEACVYTLIICSNFCLMQCEFNKGEILFFRTSHFSLIFRLLDNIFLELRERNLSLDFRSRLFSDVP